MRILSFCQSFARSDLKQNFPNVVGTVFTSFAICFPGLSQKQQRALSQRTRPGLGVFPPARDFPVQGVPTLHRGEPL